MLDARNRCMSLPTSLAFSVIRLHKMLPSMRKKCLSLGFQRSAVGCFERCRHSTGLDQRLQPARELSSSFFFFRYRNYLLNMEGDQAYLAMLNNKTINPPPREEQPQEESRASKLATPFPALTTAEQNVTSAIKDVYLVSESDEPFEWITAPWTSDKLPTAAELTELGLVDKASLGRIQTSTLEEFFKKRVAADDPYGMADKYRVLWDRLSDTFGKECSKVYFIGETSITVLIVGIITDGNDRALAGLRSLLVET